MTSAPASLGLGLGVEAEELAQRPRPAGRRRRRRPTASAAGSARAASGSRSPAPSPRSARGRSSLEVAPSGSRSRRGPARRSRRRARAARRRSAAPRASRASARSGRARRRRSARPAAPRPRGRRRCGRRSTGRRRRRGGRRPSTSRQAGSMSRGTARSIRSSGRPSRAAITSSSSSRSTMWCGRVGRRRRRCRPRQLLGQLVEADRLAAEALGEADRAVVAAVGDEDGLDAARGERLGGQLGRLAGADHEHAAAGEVAERALRELDRDRGDARRRPRRSAVSVADPLAGRERAAEEAVEDRPGGALDERQLVGALDLALDLGLAEDHRVEPGGDPEEVRGGLDAAAASRGSRAARSGGCSAWRESTPSASDSASTGSETTR